MRNFFDDPTLVQLWFSILSQLLHLEFARSGLGDTDWSVLQAMRSSRILFECPCARYFFLELRKSKVVIRKNVQGSERRQGQRHRVRARRQPSERYDIDWIISWLHPVYPYVS